MKFAIAKEHRDFFHQQGIIEFEDFLTSDQVEGLNQAINQALASRMGIRPEKWHHVSAEQAFLHGRDLWRSSDELRKWTCQPRFAEIAAELVEKKPIRLGYDQLFPALYPTQSMVKQAVYTPFIHQSTHLETISCLKGLVCGLMFCLSSPETSAAPQLPEGIDIFPRQPGYATFIHPHVLFNFHHLFQHLGQRFYLIVYTQALAHYYFQPQDPHTHQLKHLGYIFNDKLSDKLNPIVYR